jgi:Tol biopolymer transport system component
MRSIWVRFWMCLFAAPTACGHVGSPNSSEGLKDAMPDMLVSDDAPGSGICTSTRFGFLKEIRNIDSVWNEWTAVPTSDRLSLFVGSDRPGGGNNLYAASRQSVNDEFDGLVPVTKLNKANTNTFPSSISRDGRALYMFSDRSGNGDIYMATRSSLIVEFDPPTLVAGINSDSGEEFPFISADGRTLYFSSTRSGSGDLYRSTLGNNGQFGTPIPLSELNTSGVETNPVLTADELTIFFARDEDIWIAHRSTIVDGFGKPTRVTDLDSPMVERPMSISDDNCVLYFVSGGQSGSTGGIDVFMATRLP